MPQSVFITGCSTGIGYTCAHALKNQGFEVIASCRNPSDVERLNDEGLTCIPLDLANPDSIESAINQVTDLTSGSLFGLFNNGAYGQPGALEDLPTDALRAQFETNVFGWHALVQGLLPMMLKNNRGRIVQNSSVLGFVALKYRGAYNASKYALEGWTDTLRLELANTNIKVSLIEPGPIESQFRANALEKFLAHIDIDKSRHHNEYQQQLARLESESGVSKHTLPAEAVVQPLLHALTSDRPKVRYRVTTPTKLMAVCKRLLSSSQLDKVLLKG